MSLSLTRVDAWSVAKVTFMLSIAGAIIQIVAAAVVWLLLDLVVYSVRLPRLFLPLAWMLAVLI